MLLQLPCTWASSSQLTPGANLTSLNWPKYYLKVLEVTSQLVDLADENILPLTGNGLGSVRIRKFASKRVTGSAPAEKRKSLTASHLSTPPSLPPPPPSHSRMRTKLSLRSIAEENRIFQKTMHESKTSPKQSVDGKHQHPTDDQQLTQKKGTMAAPRRINQRHKSPWPSCKSVCS